MSKLIKLFVKFILLILFTVTSISSFAAYDLSSAIQKGAEDIVNTDMPLVNYDQINVTARRIVQDLEAGDSEQFTSSCGLRWDCYEFWVDQMVAALTSAVSDLQQDRNRRNRCAKAKTDWEEKSCSATRPNRPAHDYDINFSFSASFSFDRLRPAVREFQQALYDDLSDNAWPNFNQYWLKVRSVCATFPVPMVCQVAVDDYFNQFLGRGGYAAFEQSNAASDARSSRNGQVCRNIAAAKAADSCE